MNNLFVILLFLAVPALWFTWFYILYLAGTGVSLVSDIVIFIIGTLLAFLMAVVTIQEFRGMNRPQK